MANGNSYLGLASGAEELNVGKNSQMELDPGLDSQRQICLHYISLFKTNTCFLMIVQLPYIYINNPCHITSQKCKETAVKKKKSSMCFQ